jgi:hypothetical protein
MGKADDFGAFTPKSNAMRNLKLALHFGDEKGADRYAGEYFQLGGSVDSMTKSLHTMEPLYGLSSIERAAFVSTLSDEEMKQLERAGEFYFNYLAPAAMNEEDEETAPEETASPK